MTVYAGPQHVLCPVQCESSIYSRWAHVYLGCMRHYHLQEYYHKGKAIPLQAWTGPEGSKRLRLPDFKTIGT